MRKVILLSALGAITLAGADDAHKSFSKPTHGFSGTPSDFSFTTWPTQASAGFDSGHNNGHPYNGPHLQPGTAPASLSSYWLAPSTSTSGSSTSTSGSTPPELASVFSAHTTTGPPLAVSTAAGMEKKEVDNGEVVTHSEVIPTTTGGDATHSWVSASTVSITEVSRSVRNLDALLAGREADYNTGKPSVTSGGDEGSINPWASHFPTTGKGAMTSYSAQNPGHSGGGWRSMLHDSDTSSTTAEKTC